jgi:Na+-driven multidrug efflux pump
LGVEELAAAVGFAGTILFMTTSISIGMAIAGGAMVARSLGENKPERATEMLTHVLIVGLVFAILFGGMIYANLNGLTGLIGATGETQVLAVSYLKILIPTMPILLIGIVASAALRSHGAARLSMMVTLIAGVVNAVLDPIFIFVLDMGPQHVGHHPLCLFRGAIYGGRRRADRANGGRCFCRHSVIHFGRAVDEKGAT